VAGRLTPGPAQGLPVSEAGTRVRVSDRAISLMHAPVTAVAIILIVVLLRAVAHSKPRCTWARTRVALWLARTGYNDVV
jgi:hypothetical protein